MRRPFSLLASLAAAAIAALALSSDTLPLDDDAIQYTTGPVNDAVHALQERMDRGEVKLKYEGSMGYLRAGRFGHLHHFADPGFFEDEFSSAAHRAADAARPLFPRRRGGGVCALGRGAGGSRAGPETGS